MESSEAPLPKTEIELALNNILDDISKVLKEHCGSETVRTSIEVKVELTEEQISMLPREVQENLKAINRIITAYCIYFDSDGHAHNCKVVRTE